VNTIFLMNVLRVLLSRHKSNQTTDVRHIKNAARAVVLLIPLLGFTNFIHLVREDSDNVYSYSIVYTLKKILPAFQGVFISIIHCFIRSDVRRYLRRNARQYCCRHAGLMDSDEARIMSINQLRMTSDNTLAKRRRMMNKRQTVISEVSSRVGITKLDLNDKDATGIKQPRVQIRTNEV
ncbi:hypothetical protein Ciccas_012877, partial [Cichlidogyrus casuarinus]